jgi:GNAT superfamily N-acetyltransferase
MIRRARESEMRLARQLLPSVYSATQASDMLFLAETEGAPHPVGAAAIAWAPAGFPVELHVVPSFRRRGVGRALIEAVATAVEGETDRMRSWNMVGEGSPAEIFLRATGFAVTRRFFGFETDGMKFLPFIEAIRRPLVRSGRIPPGARISSLSEAPRAELIKLVSTELAAFPATVAARIAAQGSSWYDEELSVVLMLNGALVGAMLMTRSGDLGRVEVNVVAPSFRGGWANVVILDEAVRRIVGSGLKRLRFFCDEHTRDTINLAKHAGAASLGTGLFLERRIAPAQSSSSQS